MVDKIDLTDHSLAAFGRRARTRTDAIIVHHLDIGDRTFGAAIDFFTRDPEGVATVALSGTYQEKLPTIRRWRRDGISIPYVRAGFVPYHFLVDEDGRIGRMLALSAKGAHAAGWNDRSVAVCALGKFDVHEPPKPQLDTCRDLVMDMMTVYGRLRILGHDATLDEPKGCPGARFPLERLEPT